MCTLANSEDLGEMPDHTAFNQGACVTVYATVKSGNLGHRVNSDIRLQTVEIQMRRVLMSPLIGLFNVC